MTKLENKAPLFNKVLADIKKVKSKRINFIPFSNFDRFSYEYSGIYKNDYTILTANSGVGKSKFLFRQYILEPLNYVINNPESGVDIKIFFNSLEEPASKVIYNIICDFLFQQGIYIDIKQFRGIPNTDSLTDELITSIESLQEWFEVFESKVEISSFNRSTNAIFQKTKKFLDLNGEVVQEGNDKVYKPKNDNLFVEHITDHIGHISYSREEGNIYNAIAHHSGTNNLILKNLYECQVVDCQQQSKEKAKLDFNFKGTLNEQKLKPSEDGLADNKSTFNNASQVISLFAPFNFDIQEYNGYDLNLLQDSYRYLEFLKNREGSTCGIDLFYKGAIGEFTELPLVLYSDDYQKYVDVIEKFKALKPDKKKEERQEVFSL